MKRKKRPPERKPLSQAEIERRRKINAAFRHAEQTVSQTGVYEPVVYRPSSVPAAVQSRPPRSGGRATPTPSSSNSALEDALREVFRLPTAAPGSAIVRQPAKAPKTPPKPKGRTPGTAKEARTTPPSARRTDPPAGSKVDTTDKPRIVVARPKKRRTLEPEDFYASTKLKKAKRGAEAIGHLATGQSPAKSKKKSKADKAAAREAAKKQSALQALLAKAERQKAAKDSARKGKQSNDASRIAFNARLREQRDAEAKVAAAPSPFEKLQRDWNAAFTILLRYEDENPNARNVVEAKQRLNLIEAEWDRRRSLKPGEPDYFPWPSTEIGAAEAATKSSVINLYEKGMLGCLGYQVGASSPLTAAQRARLLGQVFVMRLPPLNDLEYMASWGQPDTGPRLHKIAECLAAFVKNAKRRSGVSFHTAIAHWETDLVHMRRHYYDGRFDFTWPRA